MHATIEIYRFDISYKELGVLFMRFLLFNEREAEMGRATFRS